MAHAVDEFVPVDDLVACSKALAIAALRWCNGESGAAARPVSESKETT
jgi:hypothetical protein